MNELQNEQSLREIAYELPEEGGVWRLKQTIGANGGKHRVKDFTHVSRVSILGPGDHFVGVVTGHRKFLAAGTVSYWFIAQMLLASWTIDGIIERKSEGDEK